MMPLESQVCSLELSKRLKELGVKQKSLWYWINPEYTINNVHTLMYIDDTFIDWPKPDFYYSAFTVAELGEMLPTRFYYNDSCEYVYLRVEKYIEKYKISYFDFDDKWFDWCSIESKTEADARAKMLIYLIENNLVKVEDINNED